MIADSLIRQFSLCQKPLLSISALEKKLGITGKSIENWMKGKRPLPIKWDKPLRELLYPMVDETNTMHQTCYHFDRVVVLELDQLLPRYSDYRNEMLDRTHFPLHLTQGADVVYLRFVNNRRQVAFRSIFSKYLLRELDFAPSSVRS